MSEVTLTKTRTVLKRVAVNAADGNAIFCGPDDQGDARSSIPVALVNLSEYADMGEPEYITVAIEPGDKLND